jgi:hypothetical protein
MAFETGKYVERMIDDSRKHPGCYESGNLIKGIHNLAVEFREQKPSNEQCLGIISELINSGKTFIKNDKIYPRD